ncbi:hypothetical protein C8Q74DRAFT_1253366 [Fomes fomentarius]|nr:hypothetical protein C8Q74DRAFT_1253366 [Fomes fomentarius]
MKSCRRGVTKSAGACTEGPQTIRPGAGRQPDDVAPDKKPERGLRVLLEQATRRAGSGEASRGARRIRRMLPLRQTRARLCRPRRGDGSLRTCHGR